MELRHRNRVWAEDGQHINELAADVRRLQDELAERDLAVELGRQLTFGGFGLGSQSSCSHDRA